MSLYRKYRPQTFEEVVGQDHVANTIRNALTADPLRISHAYLFCGPRGTGKTSNARLLAKCLNCEKGPTPTPCNECDFCTRVRDNQPVMDLVEIDAASNTGVDNVRENIIEKVNVAPAQGRYRIYIIDEVHMLSTSSFNALLKTLEEPPAHAVFVLATTDPHKVPTTITSRCQRFDFRRVTPRDIATRLQLVAEKENMTLSQGAARLIAFSADGALRDALTLLEQVSAFAPEKIEEIDVRLVLGTVSQELIDGIFTSIAGRDAVGVLTQLDHALEEGASFSQLARDLVSYGRDLLLETVGYTGESTLSDGEKKTRHDLAHSLSRAQLMALVEALRASEKEMRSSTDHRLLLELVLVRAASDELTMAVAPQSTQPAPAPAPAAALAPPVQSAPVASVPIPAPAPTVPANSHTAPALSTQSQGPPADGPQPIWKTEAGKEAEKAAQAASAETVPTDNAPTNKKKGRRIHDIEEFIELWSKVLMRVRKKIGITAVAYLHDAKPVGLDDNQAILEFRKMFHFEKATEAAKHHPFEQVINECLDKPRKLSFRLAEPEPEVAVEPEPEVPVPGYDEEEEEENVAALAQQIFAAEVVNR